MAGKPKPKPSPASIMKPSTTFPNGYYYPNRPKPPKK
jgi:hypothetical protein